MLGHKDNDQDVATIEHSVLNDTSMSEEEENKRLESSGNCLVNRTFQWGWLNTPLPNSLYPPVSNTVTMIPSDQARIYSETGAAIGIQHTRREQVDTNSLPGNGELNQPGSDFEEVSLNSGESTPSTVYRAIHPRVTDSDNVDKIESSLLLSDTKKGSDSDKKGETNTDTKCESNYFHGNNRSDCHKVIRTSVIVTAALC